MALDKRGGSVKDEFLLAVFLRRALANSFALLRNPAGAPSKLCLGGPWTFFITYTLSAALLNTSVLRSG